jgi:flagellar motility protein MotE (MotC chaperone)
VSTIIGQPALRPPALGLVFALLTTPAAVHAQSATPDTVPAGAEASSVLEPAADPATVIPIPIAAKTGAAVAPSPAKSAAADPMAALPPASINAPESGASSQAPAPVASASASDFAADQTDDSARQYCTNIADAAADARFARQAHALAELEKQIDERIKALEAKRSEYEDWLTRREDFLRKADESVVAIFTQMRPDAASQQMSVMEMGAAAAILAKLNPRIASAILNEMDPAKAAELTTTMAGLARPSDGAKTPG